jgi:hypothetical protein
MCDFTIEGSVGFTGTGWRNKRTESSPTGLAINSNPLFTSK